MKGGLAATDTGLPALEPALTASAQGVPPVIQETYPLGAVHAAATECSEVAHDGARGATTKYLIALGVAPRIPCRHCVYFDRPTAKHADAADAEIKGAIAAAAAVRKWSTVLNGSACDVERLRLQSDAKCAGQQR